MGYRKPTKFECPSCKITNMDDTCDGFYECDECGHNISNPTKSKQDTATNSRVDAITLYAYTEEPESLDNPNL